MMSVTSAWEGRLRPPSAVRTRTFWVKAVVAAGLLAGFLMSPRLWATKRFFPLVPVADWLPPLPPPLDGLLFSTLCLLLVVIAVAPRPRAVIGVFLALAVLVALGDQNRWQPWFYQYLALLAALAAFDERRSPDGEERTLNVCRFILAATYFWSGVQKLNVTFAGVVFPWLTEPLVRWLHVAPPPGLLGTFGWTSALLEAAVGVGLLWRPSRPVAVPAAVAMHVFLLLMLGPWGHDWNSNVWPWNVVMAVLVVLLFGRTRAVGSLAVLRPRGSPVHGAALLLFGVMPLLSYWELWDSYFSAALYSGNTIEAHIEIAPAVTDRLDPYVRQFVGSGSLGGEQLSIFYWSVGELNVPPNPARRVSRAVARSLLPLAGDPNEVVLVITECPDWRTGERQQTWYGGASLAPP
jgi:hypothetical protein